MSREQILRQAASLDPHTLQKRQALAQRQYSVACRTNWLSPSDVRKQNLDVDESEELPILDPVMQMPLAQDDVVVLSDGNCYSRQSMAQLVDSGVVDPSTGRSKLPLSGKPLTDLDYALVGRTPVDVDTQQGRRRVVETYDVQGESYQVATSQDVQREQEQRLQRWLAERKSKQGPPYQSRARAEFASALGKRRDYRAMEILLRELPRNDLKAQACALHWFAYEAADKRLPNDGSRVRKVVSPQLARRLKELAQRALNQASLLALVGQQQQCFEDEPHKLAYGELPLYSALLQTTPPKQIAAAAAAANSGVLVQAVYTALASGDKRALSTLLPAWVATINDADEFEETYNELFGGAHGPIPSDSLEFALSVIEKSPTRYAKKLSLAALLYSVLGEQFAYNDAERRKWILQLWPRYRALWTLPTRQGDEMQDARTLASVSATMGAARANNAMKLLLQIVARDAERGANTGPLESAMINAYLAQLPKDKQQQARSFLERAV